MRPRNRLKSERGSWLDRKGDPPRPAPGDADGPVGSGKVVALSGEAFIAIGLREERPGPFF
jgi:hypothetical protein